MSEQEGDQADTVSVLVILLLSLRKELSADTGEIAKQIENNRNKIVERKQL